MIRIVDKSKCSGCSSCQAVCPKNCIELMQDAEGFYYPVVDESVCVDCHLCEKSCPVLNRVVKKDELRKNYGMINVNSEIKKASSSGGVFTLLATYIIENGGVVFGAAVSKDCYSVEHIKVDTIEGLAKLRTSKYVQSNMGNCFKEAKDCLDAGTQVFFTGTPCQIGGLKTYLKKDYDNLFTQDIVCHGTPAPKVWESYIKKMEMQFGSKAQRVNFRYKAPGSKIYYMRIEFENGKVYLADKNTDLYLRGYLTNLFLKPACYDCQFKGVNRIADVTLADFWNVATYAPKLNREFGVSLVTVHTQRGRDLFDRIKEETECVEVDDAPLIANVCSVKSTLKPNGRDMFWADYEKMGAQVFDKYFALSMKEKTKRTIKKLLGR